MSLEPYHIRKPAIPSGDTYRFTTGSGLEYEVRFGRKKDNILHKSITFGVTNPEFDGDEYVETNRGEAFRVMQTIVDIVKIYLKEHPHTREVEYTPEATEKEQKAGKRPQKRINLYTRYLKRIFNEGWEIKPQGDKMLVVKKT